MAHSTSVRTMPSDTSRFSTMRSPASGEKNDGQPQLEWNFSADRKSSAPQARHEYTPSVSVSVYSPV